MRRAGIAGLAAALSFAALNASPTRAQDLGSRQPSEDGGVFEQWLSQEAPECVPVSAFQTVSTVKELTPAQFQFVRALYVALPPVSRKLPPGDHAVMASSGKSVMLALVADGQACARFLAPDFILTMLDQVGQGQNGQLGTPVSWRPDAD